ncbi:MAG: peptidoglycan DD-metalloendopeptidase family protein, partial [Acutalibacteraceae bacterium]|nr:peptidoglycan DD-metalloendopeptidase family protein [Acutalibacteraceae bacterium]
IIVVSVSVTVVVATGATSAYAVVYKGETIALVKEHSVLAEAEILAAKKLNNPLCTAELIKVNLNETLVSENNLVSASKLADVMINHSKNIVTAAVLKINGDVVAIGKSVAPVKSAINEFLNDYKIQSGTDDVEFLEEVTADKVFTVKSEVKDLPTVEDYLEFERDNLSVQTISTVTETEEIPFETIEVKDDSLTVGTKKVEVKGVKGVKEVAYEIARCNGKEVSKIAVSTVVVTEPISEKIIVGTKRPVVTQSSSSYSMLWPLKRVSGAYVSSYMGDGRGHKGMDIVSAAGTPIYAANGGTVSYAGWDSSGYGYKIIIKHSNGYETLYAHCKDIYVKVGDTVGKGETVGAVGRTGRATGNHLHFEVRKNGTILNPANFIGRN